MPSARFVATVAELGSFDAVTPLKYEHTRIHQKAHEENAKTGTGTELIFIASWTPKKGR